MKILASKRYEEELKLIFKKLVKQVDHTSAKNFKLYLDTIVLNIPTKLHKYKVSSFFDNPNVKEIDYNGFKIFIYVDDVEENIILLSIS